MNKNIRTEYFRIFILIFIILSCMLSFALIQPFGDGPDEINRFKVLHYRTP